VAIGDNKIAIADGRNRRVLFYDSNLEYIGEIREANGIALSESSSVAIGDNKIAIADTGNNRVLIYNNFPAAIGPTANPADNVIGQGNFTDTNVGISETQMTSYDAVYVDRNRLFVVDSNRVLVFSNPVVP